MSDAVREINHAGYLLDNNHITLGEFEELIKPQRDAEPITHGHWIKNDYDYDYKCSVCSMNIGGGLIPKVFHYCPNCGSKMDG